MRYVNSEETGATVRSLFFNGYRGTKKNGRINSSRIYRPDQITVSLLRSRRNLSTETALFTYTSEDLAYVLISH